MEEGITNFEIVDSPEALQASMDREAAPQQEPTQQEEPTQGYEEPQQPESQQPEPQQEASQEAQPQQEYSDEEFEAAILDYMSERLGREVSSFDDFNQRSVDERVEAISNFVAETGRPPEDWFAYQRLNPSEMDDMTLIRVDMASQYPNLSNEELSLLIDSKYKLDPDLNSQEEVKLAQLQLKIDAEKARANVEEIRNRYAAPNQEQGYEGGSFVDDQWLSSMEKEVGQMDGLEFDLGNGTNFTFGFDDDYRNTLMRRNANIEDFFDPYVREDGSWDYDKLSSHIAVIDNIDTIVKSAYRQGISEGQRGIVNNAANVGTMQPQVGQNQNASDPVLSQIKNIMGSNRGFTFNI